MLKPRPATVLKCAQRVQRASLSSRASSALFGHPAQEHAREPPPPSDGSQTKVGTVFAVLVTLGVGCTAYGIYDFYSMLTLWPPEVRADLRAAVKATHREDNVRAEAYFRKALETADTLPDSKLDLMKRTGISIALAEILPQSQAYDVLAPAYARMQAANNDLTPQERVRAIALAVRLSELASKPDDEELWGTRAVEDALRVLNSGSLPARAAAEDGLAMPQWVQRTDVAVPLERLGALYAARGRLEYALPLYLKAIDVMGAPAAGAEDRCRAGQLMNNLAEVLVARRPAPERLEQARAWAAKGIAVSDKARAELAGDAAQTCQRTCAVLLFNLGQLHEMLGDVASARAFFAQSRARAIEANFVEGTQQASGALMRIGLQREQVRQQQARNVDGK